MQRFQDSGCVSPQDLQFASNEEDPLLFALRPMARQHSHSSSAPSSSLDSGPAFSVTDTGIHEDRLAWDETSLSSAASYQNPNDAVAAVGASFPAQIDNYSFSGHGGYPSSSSVAVSNGNTHQHLSPDFDFPEQGAYNNSPYSSVAAFHASSIYSTYPTQEGHATYEIFTPGSSNMNPFGVKMEDHVKSEAGLGAAGSQSPTYLSSQTCYLPYHGDSTNMDPLAGVAIEVPMRTKGQLTAFQQLTEELTDGPAPVRTKFPCEEAGCGKTFSRPADLDRHRMQVHGSYDEKDHHFCDYEKCARHSRSFNRRDHFREHLREYHKEDLSKRSSRSKPKGDEKPAKSSKKRTGAASRKKDEEEDPTKWIEGRKIELNWWRCSKCLIRVMVVDGYECPKCKMECEKERQQARHAKALKVQANAAQEDQQLGSEIDLYSQLQEEEDDLYSPADGRDEMDMTP